MGNVIAATIADPWWNDVGIAGFCTLNTPECTVDNLRFQAEVPPAGTGDSWVDAPAGLNPGGFASNTIRMQGAAAGSVYAISLEFDLPEMLYHPDDTPGDADYHIFLKESCRDDPRFFSNRIVVAHEPVVDVPPTCAVENADCVCPNGKIRYGAGTTWTQWRDTGVDSNGANLDLDHSSGSVNCNNGIFTDPIGGPKTCQCCAEGADCDLQYTPADRALLPRPQYYKIPGRSVSNFVIQMPNALPGLRTSINVYLLAVPTPPFELEDVSPYVGGYSLIYTYRYKMMKLPNGLDGGKTAAPPIVLTGDHMLPLTTQAESCNGFVRSCFVDVDEGACPQPLLARGTQEVGGGSGDLENGGSGNTTVDLDPGTKVSKALAATMNYVLAVTCFAMAFAATGQ